MEFKQKCNGRWAFFIGGLFWTILIPCAYALIFKSFMQENIGTIIIVSLAMILLFFGAVIILINGIDGLICNGKKHLILKEDHLQIILNSGKFKGTLYDIKYEDLKGFYFTSDGTKVNKKTGKIFIKKGSSGNINFSASTKYLTDYISPKEQNFLQKWHQSKIDFTASIYDALPAAQFILSKISEKQIDHSRNELTKSGKVVIIDEDACVLEEDI